MGRDARRTSAHDIDGMLQRLRITQTGQVRRVTPTKTGKLPTRQVSQKMQSIYAAVSEVASIASADEEVIDVPMLLEISDLLREAPVVLGSTSSEEFITVDKLKMRIYVQLLRNCGLTPELHYSLLKQWSTTTSRCLTSSVFTNHKYWSETVLKLSVRHSALHCAILAVSALQHSRASSHINDDRIIVQTAYRLRAEADRRLTHSRGEQSELQEALATVMCLMLFDYHTANHEAWRTRILQAKRMLLRARYSSSHVIGKNFFWTIIRHDLLASTVTGQQGYVDENDLIWDDLEYGSEVRLDRIGQLTADLLRHITSISKLKPSSPPTEFEYVDECLTHWRARFPLALQTFEYTGNSYDQTCFYPGLASEGGPRAIVLHCLYAEAMIRLIQAVPHEMNRSQIHEHCVTICKLTQSLTTKDILLSNALPSALSQLAGSLYIAGKHLFSKAGKLWVSEALRWIASISGNLTAESMANSLEEHWREERTRPRKINLDESTKEDDSMEI